MCLDVCMRPTTEAIDKRTTHTHAARTIHPPLLLLLLLAAPTVRCRRLLSTASRRRSGRGGGGRRAVGGRAGAGGGGCWCLLLGFGVGFVLGDEILCCGVWWGGVSVGRFTPTPTHTPIGS